jgi:hypothetical protein
MSQPVKLSDPLIDAARNAAPLAHRSLAAQIEHWAELGRAIEGSLSISQTTDLKRSVRESPPPVYGNPEAAGARVAAALRYALSPEAREAFRAELLTSGQPLYGTDPAFPGCIVRDNPDGSRTPGHWVADRFEPLPEWAEPAAKTSVGK